MTEITSRLTTALADRYRIERHLGEGGIATVYLAHDQESNLRAIQTPSLSSIPHTRFTLAGSRRQRH